MNAVIYLRTSSSGNKELRQNTDRQLNDLTAYAEHKRYNILGIYEEHISGAKKRDEREELNRCIEFAKDNKCTILFSELSRLQRNIWELNKIISYFVENDINVYFQKENLTLFDDNRKVLPSTSIYISCLGMCAEIERENLQYRLKSGYDNARKKGVKVGRKVGSIQTIEEKEEKYKDVIKCLKKGQSVANTYAICTNKGVKCSISTIKRIKKDFNL